MLYSPAASGVRCSRAAPSSPPARPPAASWPRRSPSRGRPVPACWSPRLAQLALDGGHLLAQQHLALARVQRRLGLVADLGRQLQHLEPVGQQRRHLVEPLQQVDRLEQLLLLGRRDIEIGRRQVGQQAGRRRRLDGLRGTRPAPAAAGRTPRRTWSFRTRKRASSSEPVSRSARRCARRAPPGTAGPRRSR